MRYKIECVDKDIVFSEGEVKDGEVKNMIREVFDKEGCVGWWSEFNGEDDIDNIVNEIIELKEGDEYFWDEDSVLVFN